MAFTLYDGRATWDRAGKTTNAGGNQPPVASFTATPSTTAIGAPITLSAAGSSDPDGTITNYAWNFGNGTTGSGMSVSKSYPAAGTYTVTLTVTDNGGLTATTTRTVTITAANQPPVASFTATPLIAQVGVPIALSAAASSDSDGSITNYAWNFGNGTTGSGVSVSKSYAVAGTYTVTLTVTDNGGLTATTTQTLTVALAVYTWMDDALPAGAAMVGEQNVSWVNTNPLPYSGTLALKSAIAAGTHQITFVNAIAPLSAGVNDTLFAHVYLDPVNPPQQVMLQWYDGSWSHRAYWGANLIPWVGRNGPGGRYMGPLPALGQWVKLAVPASLVGLQGSTVTGMSLALYDGRASWDYVGKHRS